MPVGVAAALRSWPTQAGQGASYLRSWVAGWLLGYLEMERCWALPKMEKKKLGRQSA